MQRAGLANELSDRCAAANGKQKTNSRSRVRIRLRGFVIDYGLKDIIGEKPSKHTFDNEKRISNTGVPKLRSPLNPAKALRGR